MIEKTQVAIIGAGPAGTLLAHLLDLAGIETIQIEDQSRDHVLGRIRAGILEWGSVEVLRNCGLGERMDKEGKVHDGSSIVWRGREGFFIDVHKYAHSNLMAYGQSKIQEDLFAARDKAGAKIVFEVNNVEIHNVQSKRPSVSYKRAGKTYSIEADYIAGCDGSHGVSKNAIPASVRKIYEKSYPFGWLGIMSETSPLEKLMYCHNEKGFALASQRSPKLSRYYIQCKMSDTLEDWPDDRFWSELKTRFGPEIASKIETGPSIEKSITPLHSLVFEPMRFGNLFLAGDAAHLVPPTGAKGLNLAISDVHYLSNGLIQHYSDGKNDLLDAYSETALQRVWGAVRFSWWLTNLLHVFPNQSAFDQRIQEAELDYISSSLSAKTSICEQYAGLPLG